MKSGYERIAAAATEYFWSVVAGSIPGPSQPV